MRYKVIVIGGGHAGIEAAIFAHKILNHDNNQTANVCIVTKSKNDLGTMSCNPSIGGVGKGQLVREIDAMGGLMGIVADQSAIHYRTLNNSKGPAVHGVRSQNDRKLYKTYTHKHIEQYNIDIIEDSVEDINITNNKITSVQTSTHNLECEAAIICTGTFLGGTMYIGDEIIYGGRLNDAIPKTSLHTTLTNHNIQTSRMRTGTPPRIYANSIDFTKLEAQESQKDIDTLSFMHNDIHQKQIKCYITRTNAQTHQIIKDNIDKSAFISGIIPVKGPRYCPCIEDKVVKFAHHDSHNIFLEPEGLDSDLIYPNGIANALSKDIQNDMVRSILGMENARIQAYGYAVGYVHIDPRQLNASLELKNIQGLYCAGQINGTTGYEEAAAQGMIAGINAGLKILNKDPYVLKRSDAYIGVLINDITTKGIIEPYRIYSSRVEYRLHIRPDNADIRLTEKAYELGLIDDARMTHYNNKQRIIKDTISSISSKKYSPHQLQEFGLKFKQDGKNRDGMQIISIVNFEKATEIFPILQQPNITKHIKNFIYAEAVYANYVEDQRKEINEYENHRDQDIKIDLSNIKNLSKETQDMLTKHQPTTLADVKKIPGITPYAILNILKANA